MICPKCGATIQDELNPTCYNCLRIDNEVKRYGRHRSTAPYRHRSQASSSVESGRPQSPAQAVPSDEATPEAHRWQRQGINRLLHDMYGSDTYLSDILHENGLSSIQIELLRNRHLDNYLDRLVQELRAWLKKIFPWQHYETLCHLYQLHGRPATEAAALLEAYNIPSSKLEALQRVCLRQLRLPSRRQELEKRVVSVARAVIGGLVPAEGGEK